MNTVSRVLAAAALGVGSPAAQPAASIDWVGLWEANRSFGPEVRGEIVFSESGGKWVAEIAGFQADAKASDGAYSFELPGGRGAFRGKVVGEELRGFWIQPRTAVSGPFASPVTLRKSLGLATTGTTHPAVGSTPPPPPPSTATPTPPPTTGA